MSYQEEDPALVYVICATPRTGSSYLCEALANVPGAGAPGEWFGPSMIHKRAHEWGIGTPKSTGDAPDITSPSSYVDNVRTDAWENGALAIKVHWDQVEWCRNQLRIDPLDVVAKYSDVKYVRIYRKDIIAQTISSFIASATKVFSVRAGDPIRPNEEFENTEHVEPGYDFESLLMVLSHLASSEFGWTPYFDSTNVVPYELSYEQLDQDLTATVNRVLQHFGVAPRGTITSPLVKLRTDTNRMYAERFRLDLRRTGVLDGLPASLRSRCLADDVDAS